MDTDFDKAIQLIYDLKSQYLSELLHEEDELTKDLLREKLNELDEKKHNLYSLEVGAIEPFIQELQQNNSVIF